CEDMEWPEPGAEPTGAILFNASRYSDLSLHVWKRGSDMVSTIQGFFQDPGVIQPFPMIGPCDHLRNDGILLRSLRPDDNLADFVELGMYVRPGDHVVASLPTRPAGFVDAGFEGFARKAQNGGVAFNLYFNTETNDYVSATAPPPGAYAFQSTIGYVLPPEP